jgi:tetratricopeptide (TPR) repeat protein
VPASIREIVLEVAAARAVPWIDFEALLQSNCNHGILSGQVFLDHVHPTVESNRLLALEILKTLERSGLVRPSWNPALMEAYRAAVQAVELSPDLAEVRYEAGLAAQWLNRVDEAFTHYRRALELQPTFANAHAGLGVILEDRGQVEEAIAHYRLALQYDRPEDRPRDQDSLARALGKLSK